MKLDAKIDTPDFTVFASGFDSSTRNLYLWADTLNFYKANTDTMLIDTTPLPLLGTVPISILVDPKRDYVYAISLDGTISRLNKSAFTIKDSLNIGFGTVRRTFLNKEFSEIIILTNTNPVRYIRVDLESFTVKGTGTFAGYTACVDAKISYGRDQIYFITGTILVYVSTLTFTVVDFVNITTQMIEIDEIKPNLYYYNATNGDIIKFNLLTQVGETIPVKDYGIQNLAYDYINEKLYLLSVSPVGDIKFYQIFTNIGDNANLVGLFLIDTGIVASTTFFVDKTDTNTNVTLYATVIDQTNTRSRIFRINSEILARSRGSVQSEVLGTFEDDQDPNLFNRISGSKEYGPRFEISKLPRVHNFNVDTSPVTISGTATKIVDTVINRKSILLYNEGPNDCRIGRSNVTFTSKGFLLPVGASVALEVNGILYGICNIGLTTSLSYEDETI